MTADSQAAGSAPPPVPPTGGQHPPGQHPPGQPSPASPPPGQPPPGQVPPGQPPPGSQPGPPTPPGHAGYYGQPGPPPPPSGQASSGGRRGGVARVLGTVLVGLLTLTVGVQTWLMASLSSELDDVRGRLAAAREDQSATAERLERLEQRAAELEVLASGVLDAESVAESVLPSVFLVSAGQTSGTAFAVGENADDGTNLLTNYHVVASVWDAGDREVALERSNERYDAEIVDVHPDRDLAWLSTTQSFPGLSVESDQVSSGQPIVAVGAPHGLTDTVTTGVVSSPEQELPDGSGPWIQFDAAINPGNSGGPVINADQEVIGIATAKGGEATEGLGFAVPIDVGCHGFDIC